MTLKQLEIIEIHLHRNPGFNLVVLKVLGSAKTIPIFTSWEIVQLLEKILVSSLAVPFPCIYTLCLKLAEYNNLQLQYILIRGLQEASPACAIFTGLGKRNKSYQIDLALHEALVLSTLSEAPMYLEEKET